HRVIHPDGNIRDVQEQGKVYRDASGAPIRMIGTVLDVTDRNLLEQARTKERNFINAVLESAGALVLVLDNKGRIVRFNNECERISGYTFAEIENKYPWDTVLPRESAEEIYVEAFSGLINNPEKNTGTYKNYWVSKEGKYYYIDWANSLLVDERGEVEYVVSVGIDITEKQHALDELEKYRDKLEHLVEQRTSELKDAQNELIRKERLATLGQLTATVSHELRNPLGAMTPSLYVIQKLSSPNDEKLQQAIARIERNIGRCDRIIDELLDYTRIGTVTLSSVEIGTWLASVLEEQVIPKGILLLKNISSLDEKVFIDVDVMRRAVINVFDNACQSMQDEKNSMRVLDGATLSVTTEKTGEKLKIIFKDTGCGMPDDIKNKIFEPLFSTKGFGVGLGMPTVLQIMQQHNGGVEVISEVGMGTTVTLWIPLQDGLSEQ
ncbi:MAG: PAS domain S-box protein, partial [Cyclobacteriaceae bacterium]|nr:PAS domain S-box protein [Cyclobacteriaceae bacterium]